MQWQDVCLSVYVCPSVIRQYSVKTAKHIVELFLPFGRHTILVFPYHTLRQYFDGDPLTWLSNARGYEKTTIFDQYFAISETIQNTASYYGKEILPKLSNGTIFNYLESHLLRFQGHAIICR